MKYENRISEINNEIEAFDYERLKRLEQLQQINSELRQELTNIDHAIMTRKGEIIGLKRLIEEEGQQQEDDSNNS